MQIRLKHIYIYIWIPAGHSIVTWALRYIQLLSKNKLYLSRANQRKNRQKTGLKFCKLQADNNGSHTDMTSINDSTLTKCPPETKDYCSEIFKYPPIVPYN